MDGILPLYKPKDFTSHDCVVKLRGMLRMKKIGHTGTLDPQVEGVLPICLGEATKVIAFLTGYKKVYVADVYLGSATTTEDSDGEIVEELAVDRFPTDDEIAHVLAQFQGEIKQIPPMYSAVRVNGMRLYEYARKNIPVERPERQVTIHSIERMELPKEIASKNRFRIKVNCSKGTYIRTLCVDIGKKLGFPAHMAFLERIESDTFKMEETVTFADIAAAIENNTQASLLFPVDRLIQHFPEYQVDETVKPRILFGQKLIKSEAMPEKYPFKVKHGEELLAIYDQHPEKDNELKPIRVFNMHKV